MKHIAMNSEQKQKENAKTIEAQRQTLSHKEKEIKELKQSQLKIINQPYDQYIAFNCIFKYHTKTTGGNIQDNGTIVATTNFNFSKYGPKNLTEFNDKPWFWNDDKSDALVCHDFKNKRIKLANYSTKSYSNSINGAHLKSCKIEVRNDGKSSEIIDECINCQTLNRQDIIGTIDVRPNGFAMYVRLNQTDSGLGVSWIWLYLIELNYMAVL